MKQLNLHAPDDVRLDDVPDPEPGPRDVLVRVEVCGICGSDLGYISLGGLAGPSGVPMPLGHEFSGIVDAVGDEVRGLELGARVVVNPMAADNQIGNGGPGGAMASHVLVRNVDDDRCLLRIPDSLPFDRAALTEPLGVGMRAVDRSAARAGEKVVVLGAGPIGLAAVATLHHRGIDDVVAVDLSDTRLAIARQLGAGSVLNPKSDDVWARIRELHGTEPLFGVPMAGSDVYIEASGASPLIPQVLENAKSEARLSIVALHRQPVSVNFMLVMMKQMSILGSMVYPEDWGEMIEMLTQKDLSPMITHRFPLEQFKEALAVAGDPSAGAKVLVVP